MIMPPILTALCCALAPVPPAAAIRDSFITTTDGAQIHFLRAGDKTSAPTLVFIPGWTLSASLWRHELQTFSAGRLAVAIESRSQGESSQTASGNTPERRAQDVHELIASLGMQNVVLVGWSQGVQDVAAYIQQFGTRSVAGIVFVDSPVSAGPAEIELQPGFSKGVLSGIAVYVNHPREYAEGMVRSIFHRPPPDLDIQHIIDEAAKTPSSIGATMLMMDLFGVDRRGALDKIDKPTLVVASSESPLLEDQRAMAARIRGARLIVVQDAAHAVFIDAPAEFDRALTQLLATLPD